MTAKTIDRVFAGCLLVLGVYIVWNALDYGYMRGTTPGPGFFPFWVGLAIVGLSIANLIRSVRGLEILESQFDADTMSKAFAVGGTIAAFILVTPWLGMLVASSLLVPSVAFAIQPRWTPTFGAIVVAIAVGFPILCHFLFAVYLQVPLVRGVFGI
ncbi:MAG TPA: tripartite tricarboxylate transporter TctB family protein [Vicinamibacterales bacterium]